MIVNRLADAFLRHLGPLSSTLTGFETRVRFVDHVKGSFTFDYLTVYVAALGGGEGRKNFHKNRRFVRARRLVFTFPM
jgi:hypothetical protein